MPCTALEAVCSTQDTRKRTTIQLIPNTYSKGHVSFHLLFINLRNLRQTHPLAYLSRGRTEEVTRGCAFTGPTSGMGQTSAMARYPKAEHWKETEPQKPDLLLAIDCCFFRNFQKLQVKLNFTLILCAKMGEGERKNKAPLHKKGSKKFFKSYPYPQESQFQPFLIIIIKKSSERCGQFAFYSIP